MHAELEELKDFWVAENQGENDGIGIFQVGLLEEKCNRYNTKNFSVWTSATRGNLLVRSAQLWEGQPEQSMQKCN